MEPSANVTLRALVMLAFLAVVPLLAAVGTSFPKKIWHALRGEADESSTRSASDSQTQKSTVGSPSSFAAAPSHGLPSDRPGPASTADRGQASPPPPKWGAGAPETVESERGVRSNHVAPTSAASSHARQAVALPTRGLPSRVQDQTTDPFAAAARRLRDLGATYYVLEGFGSRGDLYRFYCRMAAPGQTTATRDFEATDRDPAQAMQRVIAQVEAWRSGRLR